jgi:transketolase
MGDGDRYFSSKGHDAPGLYAVLTALGRLDFELIHQLRRLDGLPGHPDVAATPEVVTSTGSLGMGDLEGSRLRARRPRSAARARLRPHRRRRAPGGPVLGVAPADREPGLSEITAIVDRNLVQSDTWVDRVSDLGDLEEKFKAFGWAVAHCDGHDLRLFSQTLKAFAVRGAAEARDRAHAQGRRRLVHGAGGEPAADGTRASTATTRRAELRRVRAGTAEIERRLNERLLLMEAGPVELVEAEPPEHRSAPKERQMLVKGGAYERAIVEQAEKEPGSSSSTADLRLDCGLVTFRERFPERFFECGIAEQDMVSQAGAMALAGLPAGRPLVRLLPLDAAERADLQQRDRGHEGDLRRLAGRARPGRPGHSHQSVRDISALGADARHGADRAVLGAESRPRSTGRCTARPGSVYLASSASRGRSVRAAGDRRARPRRGTVLGRRATCSSSPRAR